MIHAAAYVIFILPFTTWLGYELKRKYSLKTYWVWILAAFLVGVVGNLAPQTLHGNFLLHASGGAAATLLFVYLLKTLKIELSWLLATVLLFAFVCMLGVMNELAEYLIELTTSLIMSVDSHDTWRDFVANTTGAVVVWVTYSLFAFGRKD